MTQDTLSGTEQKDVGASRGLRAADPVPDYTAMDGPKLLKACADNGMNWATAFCQHAAKQGVTVEVDWVFAWFANAIEHSHDVRNGTGPTVLPDGSAFFIGTLTAPTRRPSHSTDVKDTQ